MAVRRSPKKSRNVGEDPLVKFCRSLRGATEDVKWGNDLIFSVGGKMFAGFPLPGGDPIGFKVDPVVFATLVGHKGVVPAPYMAKQIASCGRVLSGASTHCTLQYKVLDESAVGPYSCSR